MWSERNNASGDEGLLNPGSKLVARCTRGIIPDHPSLARWAGSYSDQMA